MTSCLNRWSNLRVSSRSSARRRPRHSSSNLNQPPQRCPHRARPGAPGADGAGTGPARRAMLLRAPHRRDSARACRDNSLRPGAGAGRQGMIPVASGPGQLLAAARRVPCFGRSAACRPAQQSACRAWRSRLEPFHHGVDDVFVDQGDAQTLARQLRELAGMLVAEPARGANLRPRCSVSTAEK